MQTWISTAMFLSYTFKNLIWGGGVFLFFLHWFVFVKMFPHNFLVLLSEPTEKKSSSPTAVLKSPLYLLFVLISKVKHY